MNHFPAIRHSWLLLFVGCGGLAVSAAVDSRASAVEKETSRLWGEGGQRWDRTGRLPDYSYAGYHRGECRLPERPPVANVRDFGAVGDGTTDDTAAFQRALQKAGGRTILIPPGRYVITEIIEIRVSNTVLKGAGPQQTVICVPKPLEKIRSNMGATTTGQPTSNYSWSGGIFWVKGRWDEKTLAKVTAPARRGETALAVDRPDVFQTGDEVCLTLRDDDSGSLTRHLYAGDPGDFSQPSTTTNTPIMRICSPISMPAWEPTSSSPAAERNSAGTVVLGAPGGISAPSGPFATRPVGRRT